MPTDLGRHVPVADHTWCLNMNWLLTIDSAGRYTNRCNPAKPKGAVYLRTIHVTETGGAGHILGSG